MLEIRHEFEDSAQIAYDDLYTEHSLQHLDGYYRWLIGLLKPRQNARLLDISCGEGALVYWAKRAGLKAWGVDFSHVALVRACEQVEGAEFVVTDGHNVPFPVASFDYVTSIGSLEHYEDPEQGMREIARLLKPTGKACILLPNAFGLLWNISSVWRTGDISDDLQPIQRYATINHWRRMLERNGLQVLRVYPHQRALPGSLRDWKWYLRRPHKLLTALIVPIVIPLNLASTLVYICQPV